MSRVAKLLPTACTLAALLAFASLSEAAPPTEKQIDQWIQQLDDEDFAVRETATTELIKAGKPAIRPLMAGAQGKSLETTSRCVRVLRDLWQSDDRDTAAAAKAAVLKLAGVEHKNASSQAREALNEHSRKIVRKLEDSGAVATLDSNGKVTALTFDHATTFAGSLDLLDDLPDVEIVHMSSNRLAGDAEVTKLKALPKLDYLDLYGSGITDAALKHFKDMPALKSLPMGNTKVTDAGLAHLKDLTRLEYVGVRGDDVTNAGVAHLANLTNLTGLYLGETKITDDGLVHLKKMTKLRDLYLNDTAVTDAGLKHLECLSSLENVHLGNTKVTDAGIKKLQEARPGVQIIGR